MKKLAVAIVLSLGLIGCRAKMNMVTDSSDNIPSPGIIESGVEFESSALDQESDIHVAGPIALDFKFYDPGEEYIEAVGRMDDSMLKRQLDRWNMLQVGDCLIYYDQTYPQDKEEMPVMYYLLDGSGAGPLFALSGDKITGISLFEEQSLLVEFIHDNLLYYYTLDLISGDFLYQNSFLDSRVTFYNGYWIETQKTGNSVMYDDWHRLTTLDDLYLVSTEGERTLIASDVGAYGFDGNQIYYTQPLQDSLLHAVDLQSHLRQALCEIGSAVWVAVEHPFLLYGTGPDQLTLAMLETGERLQQITVDYNGFSGSHWRNMTSFSDEEILFFKDVSGVAYPESALYLIHSDDSGEYAVSSIINRPAQSNYIVVGDTLYILDQKYGSSVEQVLYKASVDTLEFQPIDIS